ncbi:hypothetical protein A9K65_033370 (plasmid) [Mesorhizobium sp. WSM1497]|nr:hypothetical protein A9K65_033370 [Mesorhizobium sp. WSM1497]
MIAAGQGSGATGFCSGKAADMVLSRRGGNWRGPTIPYGRSRPTRDVRVGNKEIDLMDLTTRLVVAIGLGALLIGAFILI